MHNRKTVFLLNDSFLPQIDGVCNTVVNYAQILQSTGNQPVVITPAYPEQNDSVLPYPVYRYRSLDLRKTTGYMAGIPFSPSVARNISGYSVDVIHSHCPIVSNIMARTLRKIVDAPIIMTYHSKFEIDIANTVKTRFLQSGCCKALAENINACDEIWVVSNGTGESLRAIGYQGDYLVMPNGVDIPKGKVSDELVKSVTSVYDLPGNIPVYLFVGRMKWYKGIRTILDALAMLQKQNLDYRMVFVGGGQDFQEIQEYANTAGVNSKCIFTGPVHDRMALRAWYARANLFLFPSTYDTNGLVVREAAASALPSVLIRGSCAAEGVQDGVNGFLIDNNAESMHAILSATYGRYDLLCQVGQAASDDLYISWEDSVKVATERYDVVIENHKSGLYRRKWKFTEGLCRANGEMMDSLKSLPFYNRNK